MPKSSTETIFFVESTSTKVNYISCHSQNLQSAHFWNTIGWAPQKNETFSYLALVTNKLS
jgi:hypothetical protein